MILFFPYVRAPRRCRRRTRPTSTGSDRGHSVEPRLLGGDKPEGGPVKVAVTARDTRDQPVPNDSHRWHRGASGNDEQLARLGGIRIPEHRRSYVTLPVPRMLARHDRRSRRANCAHREVDRAGHQTRGQTVETVVAGPEYDFVYGIVVWQHA